MKASVRLPYSVTFGPPVHPFARLDATKDSVQTPWIVSLFFFFILRPSPPSAQGQFVTALFVGSANHQCHFWFSPLQLSVWDRLTKISRVVFGRIALSTRPSPL